MPCRGSKPIPRKGTETLARYGGDPFVVYGSKPIPRKGTETKQPALEGPENEMDPSLFPARGLKRIGPEV